MFDSRPTQVRWIPLLQRNFDADGISRLSRVSKIFSLGKRPIENVIHGSQWMALTRKSAAQLLSSWDNDQWLRESFEFSEVPDESYFHTILSSDGVPPWHPFIHVDWTVPSPPRVYKSTDELATLGDIEAMFVRKVELTKEDALKWVENLII